MMMNNPIQISQPMKIHNLNCMNITARPT